MKRYQLVGAVLALLVVAVLAAYAAFGLLLVVTDVASYTSEGATVSDLDYDAVLDRAGAAGYEVERVDSSGFHPDGIEDLDEDLGPDYEVFRVVFIHEDGELWATFYADEGIAEVSVFVDSSHRTGSVTADDLPPDAWLLERFTVLFEMDDATAASYVEALEADLDASEPSDPGAGTPSVTVDEPVTFQATYEEFTSQATRVETMSVPGEGWHERAYYDDDDQRLGRLEFVLGRATITHEVAGRTYRLHVDRHGGVRAEATAPVYRSLEEDEVREAFRGMFEELGIPPETVDHLQFEYRGSVW